MTGTAPGLAKLLGAVVFGAFGLAATFWIAGVIYLRPPMGGWYDVMPWDWYRHWAAWGDDPTYRPPLLRSLGIAAAVPAVFVAAILLTSSRRSNLHGRARFASTVEIARWGLFTGRGVVVGALGKRILRMPNFLSVLLTAPTGSGKGVGFVVPNLLDWSGSTVTLDMKGENFALTSKHRASLGDDVYVWAPFDEDGQTHRYNPLDYVSDNPLVRAQELETIASIFYPSVGKDDMWQNTARNLFIGLSLYLIETPTLPRTFGEVLRLGGGRGKPLREFVASLIQDRNFLPVPEWEDPETYQRVEIPEGELGPEGLPRLSEPATGALQRFLGAGNDRTSDSIYTTFAAPLGQWGSPILDAATSGNDFDLRRLRHERMSIYVIITPDMLNQASKVLNLFFSQLIALNTRQEFSRTRGHRHRALVMGDEFAAPGRMGVFEKGITYVRSYGLVFCTVCQSEGQLREPPPGGYGPETARTIVSNHAARVLYTPTEQRDANEYSEALGTMTVKSRSRQYGAGQTLVIDKGSESDQKRALMMPQEISEMSEDRQIVRIRGKRPIQCDKIAYHDHPRYLKMLRKLSPTLRGGPMTEEARDEAIARGELTVAVKCLDIALLQARNRQQKKAHVVDPDNKVAIDPASIVTSMPIAAMENPHPDKKQILETARSIATQAESGMFGQDAWQLARAYSDDNPDSDLSRLLAARAAAEAAAAGDALPDTTDADAIVPPIDDGPAHLVRASEIPVLDTPDDPDEPLYDEHVGMLVIDEDGVLSVIDAADVDDLEDASNASSDGAPDDTPHDADAADPLADVLASLPGAPPPPPETVTQRSSAPAS